MGRESIAAFTTEDWWAERREERWLLQNAHKIIKNGKIGDLAANFFSEGFSPLEKDLVAIASIYDGKIPDASERDLVCQSELLHGTDLGFKDRNRQPYFDGHSVPGKPGDLWPKWKIKIWYEVKKEKYNGVPVTFDQGTKWLLMDFPSPFCGTSAQGGEESMF